MKKILSILALLAISASAQLTATGGYSYRFDVARGITIAQDTLAAADSATLVTKYAFDAGKDWYLEVGRTAGTAGDSVKLEILVDGYNSAGVFVYRYAADTISGSAGGSFPLFVGSNHNFANATVKVKSFTGQGTQVIIRNMKLKYREAFVIQKSF